MLSPGLIRSNCQKFHIYVKIEQKIQLPPECIGRPFAEWPECYNTRYFKSPLLLTFEFYAHRTGVAHPVSKDDLLEHDMLGASYLDLYQGGAGFKAVEFKYLINLSQDSDVKFTEKNDQLHYLKRSLQHCDDFYQYLSPNEAYLEGLQSGFMGPIVSFWSRLSDRDSLVF